MLAAFFSERPDGGPNFNSLRYQRRPQIRTPPAPKYNEHSADVDQEQTEVDAGEDVLNDWNKRFLAAGGARFGTDSKEYEALGGTRTSDRKKPKRGGSGGSDTSGGSTGTPKP